MKKIAVFMLALLALSSLILTKHTVRAAEDVADEEDNTDNIEEEEPRADVEEKEEEEEFDIGKEDDKPKAVVASPDVETNFLFPRFPDGRIEVGSPVTLLITFTNNGDSIFNVGAVGASIHSPYDYKYVIQNYTARDYSNVVVAPKRQVSLEYVFTADRNLEPIEFWFSAYVAYNTTSTRYRSMVYNNTILLREPVVEMDFFKFFSYVFYAALFGGALYLGSLAVARSNESKRGKKGSPSSNEGFGGAVYKQKQESRKQK